MSAHRYWRVRSSSTSQGTYFALAELEFRSTSGGADQTGSGTALSGGDFNVTTNPPLNVFDNNTATWWASQAGGQNGGWIGYDFGSAIEILEIYMVARNDSGYNQAPSSGYIEYSDDGSNWTIQADFYSLSWTTGSNNTVTYSDPPTSNVFTTAVEIEALHDGQANAVVSSFEIEALHDGQANAVVSSFEIEALHDGQANAIITGFYLEVLTSILTIPPANGELSIVLDPLTLVSNPYTPILATANITLASLTANMEARYFSTGRDVLTSTYNNVAVTAWGNVQAISNNVLWIQNIQFADLWELNEPVRGTQSAANVDLYMYEYNYDSYPLGYDAVIDSSRVSNSSAANTVQIVASGYGYKEGDSVTIFGDTANSIPATGIVTKGPIGKELGYFKSRKGFVSDDKHLFDGDYYQDFSYEVQSSLSFGRYASILKKVLHVAGTKMFGSTEISSEYELPQAMISSIVQVSDPADNIMEINNYDIIHANNAVILTGSGETELPWILDSGSWDDYGIWKDGSVWNDG